MKALFKFLTILFCVTLFSCNTDVLTESESTIIVQLSPSLSVGDDIDQPMKNSKLRMQQSVNENPIYAIQIYENDTPYYFGLFSDVSEMQIALKTSKTYKFKIAAFKNGTGLGLKSTILADSVYYYLPNLIKLGNVFIKGDALKDIDKSSSIITNGVQKEFKEIDVFYSEKSIMIEKGTTNVDFSLLRMGFGIRFSVDALSYGVMEAYIGDDTLKLTPEQTSIFTIRQFSSSITNYSAIFNSASSYADSLTIKFKWKADNKTEVVNSAKFIFKRNVEKTIPIELNSNMIDINFEDWIDDSTVTDADGCVYNTVKIGTQVWMVENLKTTKFNDGTSIPNITDNAAWNALTSPGYCWYNNDATYKTPYGALYNWYAVNTGKLAPQGWHVASDAEWQTLRSFLIANGYNYDGTISGNKIAKALGAKTNWNTSTLAGVIGNDFSLNNSTGFSALPGGYRVYAGSFDVLGHIGSWFTSTEIDSKYVSYFKLHNDNISLENFTSEKNTGFSVRCVRD